MTLDLVSPHHREPVEYLRKRYGHTSSSHAFPSLLLWRDEMGLRICFQEDLFAVKCTRRGDNCWFFPCGSRQAVEKFLKTLLEDTSQPLCLCYMRREDVELLEDLFPGVFSVSAAPKDDEYLYDREEQLRMQGKAFRHQRNALNHLEKGCALTTEAITQENVGLAISVLRQARELRPDLTGTLSTRRAEQMLEDQWAALGMNGVIVFEGGRPVAVAAGYMISDVIYDISVCCQVSGNPDFAVYARRQLYEGLPCTVETVNAEEDLGLEGLRSLKMGMHPVGMVSMYEGVSRWEGAARQI